jgi:hypothetical protein
MSNRHERRKAAPTSGKKLAKLNTATLDQHLNHMLRRVRAEFERTGEIHPGFECLTDGEIFDVPANWPDHGAKRGAGFAPGLGWPLAPASGTQERAEMPAEIRVCPSEKSAVESGLTKSQRETVS